MNSRLKAFDRFIRKIWLEDLEEAKRRDFYWAPDLQGLNRYHRKQAIGRAKRDAVRQRRRWWNEIGASGRASVRQWDQVKANPQAVMRSITRLHSEIGWHLYKDFGGWWIVATWQHDLMVKCDPLPRYSESLTIDVPLNRRLVDHPNKGKMIRYHLGYPSHPITAIGLAVDEILRRFGVSKWERSK